MNRSTIRGLPDQPDLRRDLAAATATARKGYDLPAELARWQQRQELEHRRSQHRRSRLVLAAAALVLLLSGIALLTHRTDAGPVNPPVAPVPADTALRVGTWRVPYTHEVDGTQFSGYLYLIVNPDGTGSVTVRGTWGPTPFWNEPVDVDYRSGGDLVRLEADQSLCPSKLVLALTVTQTAPDRLRIVSAQSGPCYAPPALGAALGHTLERHPDPDAPAPRTCSAIIP